MEEQTVLTKNQIHYQKYKEGMLAYHLKNKEYYNEHSKNYSRRKRAEAKVLKEKEIVDAYLLKHGLELKSIE